MNINNIILDEKYICPICKTNKAPEIITAKEMVLGTFEPFRYGLCSECGVLWLLDKPDDISKYYNNYYSLKGDCSEKNIIKKVFRVIYRMGKNPIHEIIKQLLLRTHVNKIYQNIFYNKTYILKKLASDNSFKCEDFSYNKGFSLQLFSLFGLGINPKTRILDYGCGNGSFINELNNLGYNNVEGLDPFLKKDIVLPSGAKIRSQYLNINDFYSNKFDIITLNHVFEHIPNPFEVIDNLASILRSDGTLVLRFPNIESVEFKRYKENWWGIHAPRHFFIYSRKSLEFVLNHANLKIVDSKCDSQYDHYLYSQDYKMGIPDNSSLSVRSEDGRIVSFSEKRYYTKMAKVYNKDLVGDWIVYYIKHK